MKKILCVLLAVTLSLMILPRASRADRLMKDVVGNEWFAEDVRLLMDLGIINGGSEPVELEMETRKYGIKKIKIEPFGFHREKLSGGR